MFSFCKKLPATGLLIFLFLSCRTIPQQDEIPIPPISSSDPAIVPVDRSPKWWVDRHNNRVNNVIQNQKIIFIGDSITHGWEWTDAWKELNRQFNNRITNLGFTGDQTQHVIWRLENGEFPAGINPEYVVLMIGTNNKNIPASIAAGIGRIAEIINAVSPSAKIIILSILPSGSGSDDENTIKNNAVNEIIKNYDGHLNIKYLNIGRYYVNEDGTLKTELFTDKLHLTSAGYTLWKEKLLEVIQ
jgi:lysophospholipase L1-like esterase